MLSRRLGTVERGNYSYVIPAQGGRNGARSKRRPQCIHWSVCLSLDCTPIAGAHHDGAGRSWDSQCASRKPKRDDGPLRETSDGEASPRVHDHPAGLSVIRTLAVPSNP